jgi:hypothetical protein
MKKKLLIVAGAVVVLVCAFFLLPLIPLNTLHGAWCGDDACFNFTPDGKVIMTTSMHTQTEFRYEMEGNNIKVMLGPKGSAAMVMTKNPDGSIDGGLTGKLTERNVDGTPKRK